MQEDVLVRTQILKRSLSDHTDFQPPKVISYMPIATIRNHLGMNLDQYVSLAADRGKSSIICDETECYIRSGAIYVFDEANLRSLLVDQAEFLRYHNWPSDAEGFVRRVSAELLDTGHPIMPLVRAAFGDVLAS